MRNACSVAADGSAFIADLEHFERDPCNASLAWRHGIDGAVITK
ncbi:UNVERIFIED_ORG: hypothetical protein ABID33_003854, partial [Xanthobacter viscosus]